MKTTRRHSFIAAGVVRAPAEGFSSDQGMQKLMGVAVDAIGEIHAMYAW